MGDVAILEPVLKALLHQNKDVKVTVLTQKFFAPIFKNLENVSVYPIEKKGRHKGFLGLYKLSKELKNNQFSAIADVHSVLRSTLLKLFLFGRNFKQIDKGRKEKKDLISKKSFKQLKSSHERYADVFRKLGFTISLKNPSFPKNGTNPEIIDEFLKRNGLKKVIGIAPFAAHDGKMYALEQMKIVVAQLSRKYGVVLFGGKNDIKNLERLKLNTNIFSIAGKLSFSEELDAISNLDCMLSMDSGNAHLAAMYGVKVVTIWGVTHPFAGFAPFHQPKEYALVPNLEKYPKIPTSIYGNKHPEEYKNAADSISPETIILKIEEII